MNNISKYENREICQKCGGLCCKKSGCDYFPTDFASLIPILQSTNPLEYTSAIEALKQKEKGFFFL